MDLLVSKKPGLRPAYGMLLVQMLWGFDRIPDNFKLESVIASTGYTVGRVLRMCPIIPQVRFLLCVGMAHCDCMACGCATWCEHVST